MRTCPSLPWHEELLIGLVAVAVVVWLARWLLQQLNKGMDG